MTKRPWFITRSGIQFFPFNPNIEDIKLSDIAHALSRICRFGGHTSRFFSVAQHSINVSSLCPPELKLCGLLHDATEAYLGDLIRPLKMEMPVYKDTEERLWKLIAKKWHLPAEIPTEVKRADNICLLWERRDLIARKAEVWIDDEQELEREIPSYKVGELDSLPEAERLFLAEFNRLF